jgi:ADP-ribose pyrophosphatase YjhB (NUDIX family)
MSNFQKRLSRRAFELLLENGVMPTFDIILKSKKGVVFVKRKIPPYKNVWALPGLRMFKGESINETLSRILKQELGITANLSNKILLGQFTQKFRTEHNRQDLSTCYVVEVENLRGIKINKNHLSAVRIVEELPIPTSAMYRYFFNLYKESTLL